MGEATPFIATKVEFMREKSSSDENNILFDRPLADPPEEI